MNDHEREALDNLTPQCPVCGSDRCGNERGLIGYRCFACRTAFRHDGSVIFTFRDKYRGQLPLSL